MDTYMNLDPENLLRILHLRPRMVSEEEKRYGTFNRRMVAASLDSLLITALIAPLVDYLFLKTYGAPDFNTQAVAAHVAEQATNSSEAIRLYLEELKSSGLWDRLVTNAKWQTYVLCIYMTLCWHYWSATPGKMVCRLKIVDEKTGGKMGDWQSILRILGYFVSAFPLGLGFIWIGIDKKRRGWHDLLAGTVVISLPIRGRAGVGASTAQSAKSEQECPPPNLPPTGGGITSTPGSVSPSDSPAPSAGE